MNDDKPKKLYPYDTILPDKPINIKPPTIMATERNNKDVILDIKLTVPHEISYEKLVENFHRTMTELLLGNMPEDTKTKYTEVVTVEALDKLNYELITKDKITKRVHDKLKELDTHAPLKDLSLEAKKLLIKTINEELEEFNMEVYIFEGKLFLLNSANRRYIKYDYNTYVYDDLQKSKNTEEY